MRESKVEEHLNKRAEEIDALCLKFVSPQCSGVPDRIFIYKGHVTFIELKAPGKKPRKLQEKVIGNMKKHGANVVVLDTQKKIDDFITTLQERGSTHE